MMLHRIYDVSTSLLVERMSTQRMVDVVNDIDVAGSRQLVRDERRSPTLAKSLFGERAVRWFSSSVVDVLNRLGMILSS